MIPGPPRRAPRVLVAGDDAEVSAALCLHLPRGGYDPVCLPGPELVEALLPAVEPHAIVLVLPATPATVWGPALTASASAAQRGVRVVLVAPAREVIEPLAAVAGAERALARSAVLARPLCVLEGVAFAATPPPLPPRPGTPWETPAAAGGARGSRSAGPTPGREAAAPPDREATTSPREPPAPGRAAAPVPIARLHAPTPPAIDLASLLDEAGDASRRTPLTRIEVNVSLVSEHNFFVGATRRIDSGGVFVSTMLPPAVGTAVEIRLGLPDARKVDVQGTVAFVRDRDATGGRQAPGCGVRLTGLPIWVAEAIDRFLAARPPIVWAP